MLLDDVNCASNKYLTILQCSHSTIIDYPCTLNSNDATVYCCEFPDYYDNILLLILQILLGSGTVILILV